jgi:hypothetical protein
MVSSINFGWCSTRLRVTDQSTEMISASVITARGDANVALYKLAQPFAHFS